jgi:hypothetical protein
VNNFDAALSSLLPVVTTLSIKTILYIIVFKKRHHTFTLLTCITLGGALLIPSGIVGVPPLLAFAAGFGIAVVIMSKYTDVPIVPEGLLIIFGIEIGYAFLERLVLAPLFY